MLKPDKKTDISFKLSFMIVSYFEIVMSPFDKVCSDRCSK